MKKTLQTITAILAFAAVVTACSKTENTADEAVRKGEVTIERIMDFKQQMEEAKANPGMKSAAYMSVDDAVWNVEALFNLTYAYPELAYGKTVDCDTTLYLPVSTNDSVSINDLAAFYGMMYDAVRAIYQGVDLDDKQFLILDVEAGERSGNVQAMGINAMQGSVVGTPESGLYPRDGYFEEGISWFYGLDGGTNDSTGQFTGIMDAADTLSRLMNANLVQVAPEGCQYYYTDIKMKELAPDVQWPYISSQNPGQGLYCEFYKENPVWDDDYWLNSTQMNLHYEGECYLVQNVFRNDATDPVPTSHVLFQVTIIDMDITNGIHTILHHTQARYGHREIIISGNVDDRNPLD